MVSLEHPGENIAEHLMKEHSASPEQINGKTTEQLELLHKQYKITQEEWDYLLEDPINHKISPYLSRPGVVTDFTKLLAQAIGVEKDLNKHLPTLRQLATDCPRVFEITRRAESTVALISGRPHHLTSVVYSPEVASPYLTNLPVSASAVGQSFRLDQHSEWKDFDIEDCDLFFFKCPHNYHNMEGDLRRWAPHFKGRVVIHDTYNHGVAWNDGDRGIGLAHGIRTFLKEHSEWFFMSHTDDQYGLTVLSRLPEDRPKESLVPWSPGYGPGTELHNILKDFGFDQQPGCDCKPKQDQMDKWGVAGCRENYETIVQWMREGSERWGFGKIIRKVAGNPLKAAALSLKVNWIDPYPGLVTECIRRAEAKERESSP